MQVYSVYLRPAALSPDRDAVLIKEGFCWPAFFFGPFWALWHRMWFAGMGIFSVLIALGVAEAALRIDPATYSAVVVGVAAIIGFSGNDWRGGALISRGWQMRGLSAAPGRDMALRRFFDLHPDALDMWRPGTPVGTPLGTPVDTPLSSAPSRPSGI